MSIANIISLFGGVALFLFGMSLMGEGLKKVAGSKLELVLYRLSSTPIKGVLLGTGVTAVIQSSSATSVMVVGFVNSNMMKLGQAISVILGSILGTSITGWIICLSSIEGSGWVKLLSTSTITAVVAVIGIFLRMFCKSQTKHHVGDILMGFAVLMYGMSAMSGAVAPLKDSPEFISILTAFSNPVVGILVGAVFTAVLQSASAAVGILQALSMTGAIDFAVAYPIILGIAIGASVPVLLSSIGAKADGRRSAVAYLVVSAIGAVLCGAAYYIIEATAGLGIRHTIMNPVNIAAVNSIFRGVTVLLLMPFIGKLTKLMVRIIKESEEERSANAEFDRLDERFLAHPALAIEQSRITINSMARKSRETIGKALGLVERYDAQLAASIEADEDLVDRYEDKLGSYLMKITGRELDKHENEAVSEYLHTLSDFERISDHAYNIMEVTQEINEKKIRFSNEAYGELRVLTAALSEILDISFLAFAENNKELAYRVEPLEDQIDFICDEMKLRHVERLQNGHCSLQQGFVFNDLLTNFERVADHCSNIAIAMIELQKDEFDTHSYVIKLKEQSAHGFDDFRKAYAEKYSI